MSSNYSGTGSEIFTSVELMTGGDRRTVQSIRVPLERILDSLAAISAALGGGGTPPNAFTTAGGTKTLTNNMIVAGDEWHFDTTLRLLTGQTFELMGSGAFINVNAGAQINVDSGAQIDVAGDLNILAGGFVTIDAAGDVLINGTVVFGSGATATIDDSEDLLINDSTDAFRLTMTPQSIGTNAGVPAWVPVSPSSLGASGGWVQADVVSGFPIVFPLNLPSGDDITVVTVRVNGGLGGGHAALPSGTDRVLVSLVAVDTDGATSVLATRFDQSASVGAYNVAHSITLTNGALDSGTMPRTVSPNLAYYVVVNGATGANAIADRLAIVSVFGNCIARSYRSELMTY